MPKYKIEINSWYNGFGYKIIYEFARLEYLEMRPCALFRQLKDIENMKFNVLLFVIGASRYSQANLNFKSL